ncbi:MAG: zinc-ribbon domain-containing protein [Planctomycetota bacterium]|jgi:hypothetical protein
MNCPKCGQQNPDDVHVCTSCGSELTQPPETAESVKVRTSIVSITAFAFAVMAIVFLPFAAVSQGKIPVGIWLIAAILAIVLGIIGFIEIGLSAGKVSGKAFAELAVAIPIVFYVFMFFEATSRRRDFLIECGFNLSHLGRQMLLYANDHDNKFPRAGGPNTKWGTTPNWQADNRSDAFGLKPDGTGGSATISSSLYLLIKYYNAAPKSFICKSDYRTTMFRLSEFDSYSKEYSDLWDFGPNPSKHCSYSYNIPYSPYPLTFTNSQPKLVIAADRNPWLDPYTDTTGFKWDDQTKTGPPENIKRYQKGNSGSHQREGQNVLFMDIHVNFEKQPFCGVNDDNIYTYSNGSDIQQGAPPTLTSRPADILDSLLVNEPPKRDKK